MQQFIPSPFPNKGIKVFISLCMVFWLSAAILLSLADESVIFRWVNTNFSTFKDTVMPWITRMGEFSFIGSAGVLVVLIYQFKQYRFFFITAVLCNLIPTLINVSLKNIYRENRPLHYFGGEPWLHQISTQPENFYLSFPSGHTAGVFAFMTFLSMLLPKKYSGLAVVLFCLALATGYSRIYLTHHFLGDVLAGSLIGTIFSMLTYFAIQNISLRRQEKLDKLK